MENTIILRACRPWNSIDSGTYESYGSEPQRNIDRCLYNCPYANSECVNCLSGGKTNCSEGRPSKYNPDLLRELLRLRLSSEQICATMGIGQSTLTRYKAKTREETV